MTPSFAVCKRTKFFPSFKPLRKIVISEKSRINLMFGYSANGLKERKDYIFNIAYITVKVNISNRFYLL
jgi:hypothetical protein